MQQPAVLQHNPELGMAVGWKKWEDAGKKRPKNANKKSDSIIFSIAVKLWQSVLKSLGHVFRIGVF